MNKIDSKLCKICLNNSSQTGLTSMTSLRKFFTHVLDIHEAPSKVWLCAWCQSVLRKTAKLIKLAEESQSLLLNMKTNNITQYNFSDGYRNRLFNLSIQNNDHDDIEPKKDKTRKTKKSKTLEMDFIDMNKSSENENVLKLKTMNEIKTEVKILPVTIVAHSEVVDEDAVDGTLDTDNGFDDKIDENDDVGKEQSKPIISQHIYEQCKKIKFTLTVLNLEEQKAEMEEKKKSPKYLNRKYKCEYCAIGFMTKDVFDEHNMKHMKSHSPFECMFCHIRLNNQAVLSQHSLAHQRRFQCQLCGAILTRFNECRIHRLKCGQPVPGVCTHCKKIFTNQCSLDEHIRGVHYNKEKKFLCAFCNQKFQSKQRLALHTRTHTGAKPYSCDVCQRTFASGSNLRYHLAAHAQTRPHYCVECDKSYKTRKALRRHLVEGATHRKRNVHSCQNCLKNFTSEKLLATHMASVHTSTSLSTCGE